LGTYRHFMMKEIAEQPTATGNTLRSFINPLTAISSCSYRPLISPTPSVAPNFPPPAYLRIRQIATRRNVLLGDEANETVSKSLW